MFEFKFEFDLVLCTIRVFQHNVLFEFLDQEGDVCQMMLSTSGK